MFLSSFLVVVKSALGSSNIDVLPLGTSPAFTIPLASFEYPNVPNEARFSANVSFAFETAEESLLMVVL